MTQKNKKQFGVWMDTNHATVVGRANADTEDFTVLLLQEMPGLNIIPVKKTNIMMKEHCTQIL